MPGPGAFQLHLISSFPGNRIIQIKTCPLTLSSLSPSSPSTSSSSSIDTTFDDKQSNPLYYFIYDFESHYYNYTQQHKSKTQQPPPTMAPKKIRCKHNECKEAVQRMFGDCGFCQTQYCAKHRLPEDHSCSGLEAVSVCLVAFLSSLSSHVLVTNTTRHLQVRKAAHEQNANQLNQERTQTIKVA
ncbi:hypothetical protein BKA67DRAFT_238752 [Truncatella angustata]|uniref:AN1-type domain-containing protein n=1 Tax=Truncatella angustata TaxID=152316 RepID=A0A9P8UMM4_9PEZI|nr:uncharacterized protein BKA67DRAFT_238752 [Truncatella angustata]KAH6655469.1 hypothetical protein BKA67DRAFT_238752 [Truncatella angustata]